MRDGFFACSPQRAGRLSLIALGAIIFIFSMAVDLAAASAPLPVRGLNLSAPGPDDVPLAVRFIREALPKEGVNLLVMEFDYRYQYKSHPEVSDSDSLSEEQVKQIVAACRDAGVRLIPLINLLGHQSWAGKTFGLLRSHPEFDETRGKYPGNKDIYCRSYCPLAPGLHNVLFDLIDELANVCEADAVHVGMDEVFLLGEDDCPTAAAKTKPSCLRTRCAPCTTTWSPPTARCGCGATASWTAR